MHVACATVRVRSSRADVMAFPPAIVTALASSLMPWAFVVEGARQMRILTASVTTSMLVLVNSMNVGCAMALVRSSNADVRTFLKGIAIATATSWMPLASVVVTAQPTPMRMASVTTSTSVWVNWTRAVCAMVLVPFLSVDVLTSPPAIVIATEIRLMRWANAVETVKLTPTPMAFVTMSMIVSECLTTVACATVRVRSSLADVQEFLKAIVTVTETNWMHSACAVGAAKRTPMRMASVTTSTIAWAS